MNAPGFYPLPSDLHSQAGFLHFLPWTCYGCLALIFTRLVSDWINHCPPIPWDSFILPPPCTSPVFDMDPWFLRPHFGIQTAPVMPTAPSYPDATFITVSWTIDKALDCDLDSIVEDYLSNADLFYFDAIADPPPPEPPPITSSVSSVIGDHDPSHIARLSNVFSTSPSITISLDFPWQESKSGGVITTFLSALDELGCFPCVSSGDAPLIVDCGASVFILSVRSDFISYEPSTVKIRGLGKQNAVPGKGYLRWHVEDRCGRLVELRVPGYHVPGSGVCLLLPQ